MRVHREVTLSTIMIVSGGAGQPDQAYGGWTGRGRGGRGHTVFLAASLNQGRRRRRGAGRGQASLP